MSFSLAPVEPADVECALPPGADSIAALEWNPAGNMLAAGSWDNKVGRRKMCTLQHRRWSSPSGRQRWEGVHCR